VKSQPPGGIAALKEDEFPRFALVAVGRKRIRNGKNGGKKTKNESECDRPNEREKQAFSFSRDE